MSYIITDDKHYKNIANSIRSKMQTDREYYPDDMAIAIDNIPSSADGTDNPVIGIYYTNPDDNGNPTKVKISGWVSPNGGFPNIFTWSNAKLFIKQVEFLNCNFKTLLDNLFNGCSSLTTINLPSSLTSIDNYAFQNCSSLTTINLPDSVTTIGNYAFQNCSILSEVIFPKNLNSIGENVFKNCAVRKIDLSKGCKIISDSAFSGSAINLVNLPNNLVSIGRRAFFYSPLQTINLPNSLEGIGNEAFSGCSKLKYVTLGNNFNCKGLDLSASTGYSKKTILQWLNALADRTGDTAYKLTIGATNLAKLTEEDILIATNKNWTLA